MALRHFFKFADSLIADPLDNFYLHSTHEAASLAGDFDRKLRSIPL